MDTKRKAVGEWLRKNLLIIVGIGVGVGLLLVVLLFLLAQPAQGTATPYYFVETYDELKVALKKNTDILYPDISKYEKSNISFRIDRTPGRLSKKYGYTISGGSSQADIVLWEFEISCTELKALHKMREESGNFEKMVFYPNMQLDGIAMEHWSKDISNEKETIETYGIPPKTFIYENRYIFEYKGSQYGISGLICMLPEEQVEKDSTQEVKKGDEELLDIIKSVIRQGEENK